MEFVALGCVRGELRVEKRVADEIWKGVMDHKGEWLGSILEKKMREVGEKVKVRSIIVSQNYSVGAPYRSTSS